MMAGRAERESAPGRQRRAAWGAACATAVITSGVVSWATPDGNLVVTLVPALLLGLLAYGVARWLAFRKSG